MTCIQSHLLFASILSLLASPCLLSYHPLLGGHSNERTRQRKCCTDDTCYCHFKGPYNRLVPPVPHRCARTGRAYSLGSLRAIRTGRLYTRRAWPSTHKHASYRGRGFLYGTLVPDTKRPRKLYDGL